MTALVVAAVVVSSLLALPLASAASTGGQVSALAGFARFARQFPSGVPDSFIPLGVDIPLDNAAVQSRDDDVMEHRGLDDDEDFGVAVVDFVADEPTVTTVAPLTTVAEASSPAMAFVEVTPAPATEAPAKVDAEAVTKEPAYPRYTVDRKGHAAFYQPYPNYQMLFPPPVTYKSSPFQQEYDGDEKYESPTIYLTAAFNLCSNLSLLYCLR